MFQYVLKIIAPANRELTRQLSTEGVILQVRRGNIALGVAGTLWRVSGTGRVGIIN